MSVSNHSLKTVNPHFKSVWDGSKKMELRKDDRGFKQGDILTLKEYVPSTDSYTGREIRCVVTHLLRDFEGLQEGWAIMSIWITSMKKSKDGRE